MQFWCQQCSAKWPWNIVYVYIHQNCLGSLLNLQFQDAPATSTTPMIQDPWGRRDSLAICTSNRLPQVFLCMIMFENHFFSSTQKCILIIMCLLSHFSRVWLFATQWSPPGSSVHVILPARIQERVAMPSSRGSSWPRDLISPALAGGFLTTSARFLTWEAPIIIITMGKQLTSFGIGVKLPS